MFTTMQLIIKKKKETENAVKYALSIFVMSISKISSYLYLNIVYKMTTNMQNIWNRVVIFE